ncbi:MAG: sugar ABC transporter permease [Thermomicrobia bacterium]|nr:sugar ABC transporter permease [Thermomicrobia bacterium]
MATEQTSVPISRARSRGTLRIRTVQATIVSLLYLLPSLIAFTIFVFYPVIKSVWISLHADNPFGGTSDIFVGLDQYKSALSSDGYRNSLKVTFLYALYTVPLGLLVALLLAVMANLRLRAISVFRVAFAITIGVSVGAGAVIFALLYNPSTGALNYFLTRLGLPPIQWLTHTNSALWAIAIGTIWLGLGFNFTILLSGLQGIPEELYESAKIDGASPVRMFFNVTLPLLSPTLFFVSVISVIAAFQSFAQIDILTKGGPASSSNVVVYSIYRDAFFNFHSAYASAQAVILFVVLIALTGIQFKSLEGRVFYQ